METTSRMKDFFDIYYLSNVFDFSGKMLKDAIMLTVEHRKRVLEQDAFERIREFAYNPFLKALWLRFEPAKQNGLGFSETLLQLERFLGPVYQAVLREEDFDRQWFSSQKTWK